MYRKTKFLMVSLLVIPLLVGISLAWMWMGVAGAPLSTFGWQQVNDSGFGILQNIGTLDTYNGQMYAGTWAPIFGNSAQIWRTSNGTTWEQFSPVFTTDTQAIADTQPFSNSLYIGTANDNGTSAEIWRTDGSIWENVVSDGFGDVNNLGISSLAVFSNTLIATTLNPITGIEIWSSPTGNPGSWGQVYTNGLGFDSSLDSYNGYLYLGSGIDGVATLLRTNNLISWTTVFTDGLGNPNNTQVTSMAEFDGNFYIGMRNLTDGSEVWSTSNGVDFSPVVTGGLGNVDNQRPYGLIVYEDRLYLIFSNFSTGAEVWRTGDGESWEQVGFGGWGDALNTFADYLDKGATIFNNSLFIGTFNDETGGQIWQMLHQSYLPAIMK
jgi:hypothetical protein